MFPVETISVEHSIVTLEKMDKWFQNNFVDIPNILVLCPNGIFRSSEVSKLIERKGLAKCHQANKDISEGSYRGQRINLTCFSVINNEVYLTDFKEKLDGLLVCSNNDNEFIKKEFKQRTQNIKGKIPMLWLFGGEGSFANLVEIGEEY